MAPPPFRRRIRLDALQVVGVPVLALLPALALAGLQGLSMMVVWRITAIYLFVLLGLRILGKREFGQLSPLELVSLLMIPEIVSQALTGNDDSLMTAFTGVATLLVLVFVTSLLVHRFERAERLLAGRPTVLVHEACFMEAAMNAARITPMEVYAEMHKAGIEALSDVRWAILEPDGSIAIIARSGQQGAGGAQPDHERRVAG